VSATANFSAELDEAIEVLNNLEITLDNEFESLKSHDLETFQQIQSNKILLLKSLQRFDQQKTQFLLAQSQKPDSSIELENLLANKDKEKWHSFLVCLKNCDELHRKIDFYLAQKIQNTNAILDILQINKSHNATKLYDAYGNNKLSTIGNKITEA